jgi:hypothetical protein
MRLPMACHQCLVQSERDGIPQIMMLSPTDDGSYTFTCNAGHSGLTILQQDRFQLLFQIGIHALVDGYPREAVADFAASLERFYEFYFRLYCVANRVPQDVQSKTWSTVAAQSERQLGLFLGAHLSLTGTAGPTLSGESARFRNEVIHKGRIPTIGEATAFGESVSDLIQPILEDIHARYAEPLQMIEMNRIFEIAKGRHAGTMFYPTYLQFGTRDVTLKKAIKQASMPPWNYR